MLKKTETSNVPGENTSAYQPFITKPEPFEKIFFDLDDIREKFKKTF